MEIANSSLNGVMTTLCKALLREGLDVERKSNTGSAMKEFNGPVLVHITNPWHNTLLLQGRNANPWVSLAEFPWLMAGRNDVAWLRPYLPKAEAFSDDGVVWRAGYGPRMRDWQDGFAGRDQLEYVVATLDKKPDSRHAVINFWHPVHDAIRTPEHASKDIPCTNWMHFQIVEGALNLTVVMRSNDLFWGFSGVNVYNFTMLQQVVAACLKVPVGVYSHLSNNLHVYDRHFEALDNIASTRQVDMYDCIDSRHLVEADLPGLNLSAVERLAYFSKACVEAVKTVQRIRDTVDPLVLENMVMGDHSVFAPTSSRWVQDWCYTMLLHGVLLEVAQPPRRLENLLQKIRREDWRLAVTSYVLKLYGKRMWLTDEEANRIAGVVCGACGRHGRDAVELGSVVLGRQPGHLTKEFAYGVVAQGPKS